MGPKRRIWRHLGPFVVAAHKRCPRRTIHHSVVAIRRGCRRLVVVVLWSFCCCGDGVYYCRIQM